MNLQVFPFTTAGPTGAVTKGDTSRPEGDDTLACLCAAKKENVQACFKSSFRIFLKFYRWDSRSHIEFTALIEGSRFGMGQMDPDIPLGYLYGGLGDEQDLEGSFPWAVVVILG